MDNSTTTIEIAPGVILKLRYPIPSSREEAIERLRACLLDPEKSRILFEPFFSYCPAIA